MRGVGVGVGVRRCGCVCVVGGGMKLAYPLVLVGVYDT